MRDEAPRARSRTESLESSGNGYHEKNIPSKKQNYDNDPFGDEDGEDGGTKYRTLGWVQGSMIMVHGLRTSRCIVARC